MSNSSAHIVVCGAGVIGAATAYFLTRRGARVTIIEQDRPACAASGKAGGFLALDWCDDTALQALARRSFALHAELAANLPDDYGYRRLQTWAATAHASASHASASQPERAAAPDPDQPDWLNPQARVYAQLGDERSTAQVHPQLFTEALLNAALRQGAQLLKGRVGGLEWRDKHLSGVRIDDTIMAADQVVLALGPWTSQAASWLSLPPVFGLKGHSIVLKPRQPLGPAALFVDFHGRRGEQLSPELFSRPDGDVYLCGLPEQSAVPDQPQQVQSDPASGAQLLDIAATLSSNLAGLQPERLQACYRPVTMDGLPFLGAVSDGVYLATCHSVWGILNAPASGLALSELMLDGQAHSIDLTPFDPIRLMNPA